MTGMDGTIIEQLCPKMLDEVPVAVLLIENGMFVYCNRAAVDMFHATRPDQIVGKPPGILSPELQPDGQSSQDKAVSIITDAIKGKPQRFEWVHARMDGTPFFAEVRLVKVDIMGRTFLQTNIIDIEHRKRQMDDLYHILDGATAAILLIQDGKFSYCNKAALQVFGAEKREDIIGMAPGFFSPEVQPDGSPSDQKSMTYIREAMNGRMQRFEWVHKRLDGTLYDADVGLNRVELDGKTYLQTTIFDISSQKRQIKLMEHLSSFLNLEVNRLGKNLYQLSLGSFDLDYAISEPDEFTRDAHDLFEKIYASLKQAIDSIRIMMDDASLLSQAALEGRLDARADLTRHKGEFRRIVEGMNKVLAAVMIPVREAYRVSDEYARYNFHVQFDPSISVMGEFQRFKEALNTIGTSISDAIHHLKDEIQTLSENASHARAGVEDVNRGAQEIAKNAEETSMNADKALEGIDQVLQGMSDLTTMVSDIAAGTDEASRLSDETNTLARKGIESAGDAEHGMESITQSSHEVDVIVKEIQDQMGQIRKIVSIITDIANQTNLLALNAAIEAARAGEAGRGFAVVAAEVKALAQESRSSAESISDMIQALESKSEQAVMAIDRSEKAVKEGNKALGITLDVFRDLSNAVGTISEKMAFVARSIESQAASFEEITASAQEMSVLVKKTADDATQSSATSEEALAVVSQINSVIDAINAAVHSMNDEMKKFSLKK
ncbi:methyl-accepting chemotaxis protein [Methanospirillum hungatei]|uniref:methyl-accepting chemotaxis protein n=1 Tax=Methanospirillum hungatei TaxID=2203 RepID=UPI0026ED313A|nr:methyl-accepting chemotaxis protein [Methanospirillum hungatei]MCA1915233.1 methyl-accepting chemotaxis protein [Methanospirillum hungatei]